MAMRLRKGLPIPVYPGSFLNLAILAQTCWLWLPIARNWLGQNYIAQIVELRFFQVIYGQIEVIELILNEAGRLSIFKETTSG